VTQPGGQAHPTVPNPKALRQSGSAAKAATAYVHARTLPPTAKNPAAAPTALVGSKVAARCDCLNKTSDLALQRRANSPFLAAARIAVDVGVLAHVSPHRSHGFFSCVSMQGRPMVRLKSPSSF